MINIMMRMVIRIMPKKHEEYHQIKMIMRMMTKIMMMNIEHHDENDDERR